MVLITIERLMMYDSIGIFYIIEPTLLKVGIFIRNKYITYFMLCLLDSSMGFYVSEWWREWWSWDKVKNAIRSLSGRLGFEKVQN